MAEVTEELCQARIEVINTALRNIQRDGEETRKGVGNLNRKLFEGNGSAALDTVIRANSDWRLNQQKKEDARDRFKWTRNLSWMIAGAGWAIAVIIFLLEK